MARRFPSALVSFLLGSAALVYFVSWILPSLSSNSVKGQAAAHLLLWIAFALFGSALLEIAIIYFPGLTGPKSAFLALMVGLTAFAGWAGETQISSWISGNSPQQDTTTIFSHLPSLPEPSTEPRASEPSADQSQQSDDNRQEEDTRQDSRSPSRDETHTTQRGPEIRINPNAGTTTVALNQQLCGVRGAPPCGPSKLPRITQTQLDIIRDAMKPYAGLRFVLIREDPTADSLQYADQIYAALTAAGLVNSSDRSATSNGRSDPGGVSLRVGNKESEAASSMSSAMRKAGLIQGSLRISESFAPEDFLVVVAPTH